MATQRWETIFGFRVEGLGAAKTVTREISQVENALQHLQGAQKRSEPFGAPLAMDASGQQALARTTLRDYDQLTRAVGNLRRAELARADAHRRLNITDRMDKDWVGKKDPSGGMLRGATAVAREDLDIKSRVNVDRASQALWKAYQDAAKMVRQEALNARQRAALGPSIAAQVGKPVTAGAAAQNRLKQIAEEGVTKSRANQKELDRAERESIAAAKREATARARAAAETQKVAARRAGAMAKQRAVDDEAARQQRIFQSYKAPFAEPDTSTRVGKAQSDVNKASRAEAVAANEVAELKRRGTATSKALHAAEQNLLNSTEALKTAHRNLAGAEAGLANAQRTLVGQTRAQFMAGFRGASDTPYAQQIGQAMKFSVFYGTAYRLLSMFTQTLQTTLSEGIEFQQAMTELKIASGRTAKSADELATNLGNQASAAGLAPSEGVTIGARSLGLFGATGASGASNAEQDAVSRISTHVVSRMALGTETTTQELQVQLAAVAKAFEGGAAGQLRAYDLDAYLGRQYGTEQGMITQAVAESANVGQAAGFDQEQISAIAAALQSGTGQTASTVAGWMAQFFSRGGEGALTNITAKYGIDPTLQLSDQIAQLAEIFASASSQEQTEILASTGRGKIQNAAEIILGGWEGIDATAGRARTESEGAGDEIFGERLKNLGAQLSLTVADMKAFASELSKSGILEILGAGVVAFTELTQTATAMVQGWNKLPGVLKAAIAAIVAYTWATRTASGKAVADSLLGAAGSGARSGPAGAGGLAKAAPWAAALAGLWAVSELKESTEAFILAQKTATKSLSKSGLTPDSPPEEMLGRAADLKAQAEAARKEANSWQQKIMKFGGGEDDALNSTAKTLDAEAATLEAAAKYLMDKADAEIASPPTAITAFDAESLSKTMDNIAASGGTAEDQFRALRKALLDSGYAAKSLADDFDPKEFAVTTANPVFDALVGQGKGTEGLEGLAVTQQANQAAIDATPQALLVRLGGIEGLEKLLEERGKTMESLKDLTEEEAVEIATMIADAAGVDWMVGDETDRYAAAIDRVRVVLQDQAKGVGMVVGLTKLSDVDLTSALNDVLAKSEAAIADLPESDFRGRARLARAALKTLEQTIKARGGEGADETAGPALARARALIAQREFDEFENLRRAAQRNAKGRAEKSRVGHRFLRSELRSAVDNANQDLLVKIIGQAGAAGRNIADGMLREAIKAAQEAQRQRRALLKLQARAASLFKAITFGWAKDLKFDSVPQGPKPQKYKDMLDALNNAQSAGSWQEDVYSSASDVPGFQAPSKGDKKAKAEDKKADREAERQSMLELRANLYLLSIDMTDPLAMAVAGVKDARRRLRSDIGSGQDRNTIVASRVALKQAQNEREATAFQQRLDSVTTADELGRISHRKYISYLTNERRRLNAIKKRTFQQQQQLDTIDRLMKDAAQQMQGQWNFGDIKLPTPYQIRRQVESMRTDRATGLDATSRQASKSQTTIYIDGADTGKVRQIINETFSKCNANVTNRPRRR